MELFIPPNLSKTEEMGFRFKRNGTAVSLTRSIRSLEVLGAPVLSCRLHRKPLIPLKIVRLTSGETSSSFRMTALFGDPRLLFLALSKVRKEPEPALSNVQFIKLLFLLG